MPRRKDRFGYDVTIPATTARVVDTAVEILGDPDRDALNTRAYEGQRRANLAQKKLAKIFRMCRSGGVSTPAIQKGRHPSPIRAKRPRLALDTGRGAFAHPGAF